MDSNMKTSAIIFVSTNLNILESEKIYFWFQKIIINPTLAMVIDNGVKSKNPDQTQVRFNWPEEILRTLQHPNPICDYQVLLV